MGYPFDPSTRKIPHASEQLSPGTTISGCSGAQEPKLLKPVSPRDHALPLGKPLQHDAHTPGFKRSPCSLQLDSLSAATMTLNKLKKKKKRGIEIPR